MTKRILEKFNIVEDSFEDYVTVCIIEGNPHNSQNDYAASAKDNIFNMGYLISLNTYENETILISLLNKTDKKVIFSNSEDTELDAVFSAYDWLLENE